MKNFVHEGAVHRFVGVWESRQIQQQLSALQRFALLYAATDTFTIVGTRNIKNQIEQKLKSWGLNPSWATYVIIPIKIMQALRNALLQLTEAGASA